MFQQDSTIPPGSSAPGGDTTNQPEGATNTQQEMGGAGQLLDSQRDPLHPCGTQGVYHGSEDEGSSDGDASPERIAAYDLDLNSLRSELQAYVKPSPKAKIKRIALPATSTAPRARTPLEGPCDALVVFIHPEICDTCGSIHRSHFIGLRRPLRGGGYAYCAATPDLWAVARHLPTLRRFQHETTVPCCSACCADFPLESDASGRIEVNHLSRVETHDDFETFTQPARQLKDEETTDEPTNDQ